MSGEYNNNTRNYAACAYNTLSSYNQGQGSGISPPMPAGVPSMRTAVVPVYGAMSYDTLTNGQLATCQGHFTITNAYPSYGNCTKYTTRLCSS
jgi:hypothetical protein